MTEQNFYLLFDLNLTSYSEKNVTNNLNWHPADEINTIPGKFPINSSSVKLEPRSQSFIRVQVKSAR